MRNELSSRPGLIALTFCILTCSSLGCGGGGADSGSGNENLAGVYRGTLFEIQNTCRSLINSADSASVMWTINQEGKRIVLNASTGSTYEGATTGSNSLRVGKTVPSTNGCETTTTVEMNNIGSSGADVELEIAGICGPVRCVVGYAGSIERS